MGMKGRETQDSDARGSVLAQRWLSHPSSGTLTIQHTGKGVLECPEQAARGRWPWSEVSPPPLVSQPSTGPRETQEQRAHVLGSICLSFHSFIHSFTHACMASFIHSSTHSLIQYQALSVPQALCQALKIAPCPHQEAGHGLGQRKVTGQGTRVETMHLAQAIRDFP